jgi:hypothetical protein
MTQIRDHDALVSPCPVRSCAPFRPKRGVPLLAKRAVDDDLVQGALDGGEFLIVEAGDEEV